MADVSFILIDELKTRLNVPTLELGWSHRGKLILVDDKDKPTFTLKCQQDLDVTKPLAYLIGEDGVLHNGCLVNVDRNMKPLNEVVMTL